LEKYGALGNAGIKMAVYRTSPMRYLLEREKAGHRVGEVPVIYRNKTAPELNKEA
jgi:hypothetical protein